MEYNSISATSRKPNYSSDYNPYAGIIQSQSYAVNSFDPPLKRQSLPLEALEDQVSKARSNEQRPSTIVSSLSNFNSGDQHHSKSIHRSPQQQSTSCSSTPMPPTIISVGESLTEDFPLESRSKQTRSFALLPFPSYLPSKSSIVLPVSWKDCASPRMIGQAVAAAGRVSSEEMSNLNQQKRKREVDENSSDRQQHVIRSVPSVNFSDADRNQDPGGITKVTCFHASVCQKSYGKEKRLLVPPPMVRISGPMTRLEFNPSSQMTIMASDGSKQINEKSPLNLSVNPEPASSTSQLSTSFKTLYVASTTATKTITLRLSLHPPPPSLPHQDARVISVSHDPILLPAFATFDSSTVHIISKPSRKTARARSTKSCLMNGSKVAFFSRINSQTVRTRFLGVDEARELVSRSTTWSAFRIDMVDPITFIPIAVLTPIVASSSSITPAPPIPILYGSTIVLTDVTTSTSSPPLIIRQVEKNKVILDADGPVSQLQKIAFERIIPKRTVEKSGATGGAVIGQTRESESIYLSTSATGADENGKSLTASVDNNQGGGGGDDESSEASRKRMKFGGDVVVGKGGQASTSASQSTPTTSSIVAVTPSAAAAKRSRVTYLPPSEIIYSTAATAPASPTGSEETSEGKTKKTAKKGKAKATYDESGEIIEETEDQEETEATGEMHVIDDMQSWTAIGITSFSYSFFDSHPGPICALPLHAITPFPDLASPPVWYSKQRELHLSVSKFFHLSTELRQPTPLQVWLGPLGPLAIQIALPQDEVTQAPVDPSTLVGSSLPTLVIVSLPSFGTITEAVSASTAPSPPVAPTAAVASSSHGLSLYATSSSATHASASSSIHSALQRTSYTPSQSTPVLYSLPLLLVRPCDGAGYVTGYEIVVEKYEGWNNDGGKEVKWKVRVV